MSAAPFLWSQMFEDFTGQTLNEHDVRRSVEVLKELMGPFCAVLHPVPSTSGCGRPRDRASAQESSVKLNPNDNKTFEISLDVKEFKSEELQITVEGNTIVVEGRHEERPDENGTVSRQFTRKYNIPDDVDQSSLTSKLSSDSVLTLQASKKIKEEEKKVFEIPIIHTSLPIQIHQYNQTSPSEGNIQPSTSQDTSKQTQ